MPKSITLSINKDGIANICFDLKNEKVNKLSSTVLRELNQILDDLAKKKNIKIALFTSKKKGIFIAGADINEIKDMTDEKNTYSLVFNGQQILNKITHLPYPTIAIINGACLGGGLELALCCDYRVVTDNSKVALGAPEVNLGIIPGFGGTQRLPRLVGLVAALQMILSGKSVNAKKALRICLADILIPDAFLNERLTSFINEITSKKNKYLLKRKKIKKNEIIYKKLLGLKSLIFYLTKKNLLKKTKGHYPAPIVALKVIKKTYLKKSLNKGLNIEIKEFAKLAVSETCKYLISLFFLNEQIKKDPGVKGKVSTKEIDQAAVLGAGVMGGGISWMFSKIDIPIRMKDLSWDRIAIGYDQAKKIYNQLKRLRKYNSSQINLKMNKISGTIDYKGLMNSDIIVEAIVENMDIKKKAFKELEKHVSKDTIIASNTSALPITEMAKALKKPDRFIGMHFFNPVNRMPLVEVIKAEKTSPKTIATIVELSKKAKKTPIVVKDVPGFLINRILMSYVNESGFILQECPDIKRIDNLIENFGMPMGPFFLVDTIGIDICAKVGKILYEAYGYRMQAAQVFQVVTDKEKWLGKKGGKGFYLYKGKSKTINPDLNRILKQIQKLDKSNISKLSDIDIVERCVLTMINEAARCLQEKVIERADYLDMAMIMGTGYPPFRGGLLKYADNYGIKNIVDKLEAFTRKYGERFQPAEILVDMAINNETFYK